MIRTCCLYLHWGLCLLWLAWITAPKVWGQDAQESIERLVEEASSLTAAEQQMDVLYEQLSAYVSQPLNVNAATPEEWIQTQLLTEFEIQSLAAYIQEYGPLASVYELQYVVGFTPELQALLLPFVCAEPVGTWQDALGTKALTQGRHDVVLRYKQVLEVQQGYTPVQDDYLAQHPNSRYLGSPTYLFMRYKYRYKNTLQWAFTAEKDAGEPFFAGYNRQGFDYYSGHVQLGRIGHMRTLVVGDYYAQFGQGLALWQSGAFGKSSAALNVGRRGRGVVGYTGTDENNFLRGAATTWQWGRWQASAMMSHKWVDATADSLGEFGSLPQTGLHNTLGSMQTKHAISASLVAANASYRFNTLQMGVTGVWHHFGGHYSKEIKPYNQFELAANQNANLSTDWRWHHKQWQVFGELGMSQNLGKALLIGTLINVAPPLQLALLYRHYDRHYQAYYSNAFGETTHTANEQGVYVGAILQLHRSAKLSGYVDSYTFPWLRYTAQAPSKGIDALAQLDLAPGRGIEMYLRATYQRKEETLAALLLPTKAVGNVQHTGLRYNLRYQLVAGVDAQTRFEHVGYQPAGQSAEHGYLVLQDIKYSVRSNKLSLSVRYAMFNTPSYQSRLYAYERDMLYAFSVPAYFGNASRWYINLHWRIHRQVDLWLRLAQTYYFDRETTGSGLNTIQAPHHTEGKVQLRIKL